MPPVSVVVFGAPALGEGPTVPGIGTALKYITHSAHVSVAKMRFVVIAVTVVVTWCSSYLLGCLAQVAWTPIYVKGNSQIDLWTVATSGCSCPWGEAAVTTSVAAKVGDGDGGGGGGGGDCACCVTDGGCHCGRDSPHRCTQCGLEAHCNHMCNITINSSELYAKSGKTFGQIKSPSLEGPSFCWYILLPTVHQRVEIQVYRLVNTGRHNGTSCVGGYLQLMSGSEPIYTPHENQLCGNERYTPPVVFFSDDGIASLLFEVTEKTARSQFLAYFSFSARNNTDGLGFQPRGGMRLQNTDCDWLYQDFACQAAGECVLASPGYPGIYPPHRQCKYHITTGSENVLVRITFTALLLNHDSCKTDYVAVYLGTTTSSPILDTLCGTQRKKLEYCGTNLLIEFRSGAQVPPFEYNGFVANLQFLERRVTTPEPEVTLPPLPPPIQPQIKNHIGNDSVSLESNNFPGCDIFISGNSTRFGQFDTRDYEWYPVCRITFRGRPNDIVQIMLYNFRLRAPNCKTVVEVFDGPFETKKHIIEKLCSPQMKQARDPDDLYNKKLWSSKNELVIFLQRATAPTSTNEAEFLAGRFLFHDEQIGGTVKPAGVCDVVYRGSTSPLTGMIDNDSLEHFITNVDGPLQCSQEFIPAGNQSITIKVEHLKEMSRDPTCMTECGDHGCQCVSTSPLSKIDHLMIVNWESWNVACLCGVHGSEWLPVSVRSWGPLTLIYSVANYNGPKKRGFDLAASYIFNKDTVCGKQTYTLHQGEIVLRNVTTVDNLNHFYEQSCTWSLHSNVERQLELEISSVQNRMCSAWNISIHEYNPNDHIHHLGEVLHTFCPRDMNKVYLLPWKVNTVIVRLHTLSRTLPQFRVRWKSVVRNTRYTTPTQSPNSMSPSAAQSIRRATGRELQALVALTAICVSS